MASVAAQTSWGVRHIALTMFGFATFVSAAATTNAFAQNTDEESITFPNDQWDLQGVSALEIGPKYLPVNFDTGVSAPPSANSQQTRSELRELADNKKMRNAQQRELILAEAQTGGVVQAFIAEGHFDPETKPATSALISQMVRDVEFFMFRDKLKYRRPAPSQLSSDLDIVGEAPNYPSYPSGHAIMAYMGSMIMSDLDPNNAGKYMKLAEDISIRREIAGYNYPSDTQAGKQAAVALYEELIKVPEIKKIRAAATKEF